VNCSDQDIEGKKLRRVEEGGWEDGRMPHLRFSSSFLHPDTS